MALSLLKSKLPRLNLSNVKLNRLLSSSCAEKKGLVIGAFYDENSSTLELTSTAKKYNELTKGRLLESLQIAGNDLKEGKTLLFWGLSPNFSSVAVVGLGPKCKEENENELICTEKESIRIASAAGCRALQSVGVNDISVDSFGDAESAAEGSILGTWKFQEYKAKKETTPTINLFAKNDKESKMEWNEGVVKANAQNLARLLADTPSNFMTPTIFCERVLDIFKKYDVHVEVHDEKWARNEKMCSFLAVGKGSREPPKFLELSYSKGLNKGQPIVLVGKGVTFDSGGISLKPSAQMDEMRADMSGAACVVATLYALSRLGVETNVKALIPLVENMPSGSAVKPGDVIYARNGKSICVDNTDAEGRLILADALCYSACYTPKWVLDIATLTGAMRVALGNAATGVFTNSNKLYEKLQNAGTITGDRVWRFPLWKFYSKQVTDYPAFDVNNVGKGKGGGSCTAAAFLKEFIPEKTPWLHLDIASVMGPNDETPYLNKGMTGRPTRTLFEFIKNESAK